MDPEHIANLGWRIGFRMKVSCPGRTTRQEQDRIRDLARPYRVPNAAPAASTPKVAGGIRAGRDNPRQPNPPHRSHSRREIDGPAQR